MQIISHGIDLVQCERVEQMLERHGERFLERVFTPAEQTYSRRFEKGMIERLAGRFAAKEAVLKALGTGWRDGIAWTDVETTNNPAGKPEISLHGKVQELARQQGIQQIHISITHAGGLAQASAIAVGQ